MSSRTPAPDGPQSAIAAAAKALNDATVALSDALRTASGSVATSAAEAVEKDVAHGLRSAARTVEKVAATLSTRGAKRDRTRTDLLVAAATVFAEQGYDGTSVDDVAAAAGYTKGAVYSHFGSKAGLFLAIFEQPESAAGLPLPEADHERLDAVDPCLVLTHELMLFALRTPEERDRAVALLSATLRAGVDRLVAAGQADRQAALEELLAETALRHTVSLLRSVGVPEVDEQTARRVVDGHTGRTP